jgi:seryl-tRNA synthetase
VIDLRLLRTDPEGVRSGVARRHKPAMLALLDEAIALDERLRELTSARDGLRAEINELSRQVGTHKRNGAEAEAEAAAEQSRQLGDTEREMAARFDEVSEQLRQLMLVIPIFLTPTLPTGRAMQTIRCVKARWSPKNSPSISGFRIGIRRRHLGF